MSRIDRTLLIGAAIATPLFIGLWAVQAFTREGFRPTFHPMSLLSLGDGGWVQIANFVVTGALIAGGGVAVGRVLAGPLRVWAAAAIVLMGVGLIIAGVFPTDPGAGFPAGAPEGAPVMTWQGGIHQLGFVLTQCAFLAASVLLSIRFGRNGRRVWMIGCIAAAIGAVAVSALGSPETLAIRLVVASVVELGMVSALAVAALRGRVG